MSQLYLSVTHFAGKALIDEKVKSEKGMDVMMCYEGELDDDEETGTDAEDDCGNLSPSVRGPPPQPVTPEKNSKAIDLIR